MFLCKFSMYLNTSILLLLLPMIILLSCSVARDENQVTAPVDHYLLASTWPPTFCLDHPTPECLGAPHGSYTIHGVFTADKKEKPIKCGKAPTFDKSQIDSKLEAELKKFWPSLEGDDVKFWEKEWKKHGCLTNWKIKEFFQTGISLRKSLNESIHTDSCKKVPNPQGDAVYEYLKIMGMTPGWTTYPLTDFENVFQWIKKPRGDSIIVKCLEKDERSHLWELQFCFSTNTFKLMPCKVTKNKYCESDVVYTYYHHQSVVSVEDNDGSVSAW